MARLSLRACRYCNCEFEGPFVEFNPGFYCRACSNERRQVARNAFSSLEIAATGEGDYFAPVELLVCVEERS